ncbi:DUF6044 family protein [Peribacillus kribbensis]|uniref:DUF6044 family protein n=1 Tax=Peribacillus kribbensis TaxID=356658 RepID=UPI0003FA1C38|nr:DUF6044 family protein [Peribacillus kribbensis]
MWFFWESERRQIGFGILIILLYLSPLILLGEDAHIRVHDNLDSNLAWYKVLASSGQMFGSIHAVIPQIINGLPRNAFGTEWSGIVWIFAWLPTMAAYTVNQAFTRMIAFLGMYLLLKRHFLPKKEWGFIAAGASLTFALTPYWPSGMLSTLGMPLALYAFLNIRKGRYSWKDFLILVFLPFYSSFVLGFFFFLSAMGILWVTDLIRGRGVNLRFLGSLSLMTLIYLCIEYRLVSSFFLAGEPNSRDEYLHARLSFMDAVKLSVKNYVLGHTHDMTVHGLVILPLTFIALYAVWVHKLWKQEYHFVLLMGVNVLLSIWYAFWFYKGWEPATVKFHFLNTFNFARFHFLRPLILYVLFALSLKILFNHRVFNRKGAAWFLVFQICVLAGCNDEIIYHSKPTVREFYSEKLFAQIKDYIGEPQESYRVANIGLHPAIAQYNGFYTLDTYNNFYPLSYKHEFRKIIARELDKNKTIEQYFDEWGGRCYLFTSQLGKKYMVKKQSKKRLEHLQLDMEPFKKLGGKYIFSAVPIMNAEENHLVLEKTFSSKEAVWKIYLYKVSL